MPVSSLSYAFTYLRCWPFSRVFFQFFLLIQLCFIPLGYAQIDIFKSQSAKQLVTVLSDSQVQLADKALQQAFLERAKKLQIKGQGVVIRLLKDDVKGSQHQRFIVQLTTKQTLLIAHNIDLAPRLNQLKVGDDVTFYGVYEWNKKGGVIHWTHHDPKGKHIGGWLLHKGKIYQ
ncbi:hypothetical protein C2869_16505 [Saccharobesus litoralis]|uniref:DUF3465 domain-containing protein n=1 Tax=Saccharobesus litoralis TaxID=2172099 RepID=A0A2S0VUM2_9ALTE|nr:DUF3465 domain-containing protein [Saccharobesus litoralis]AWB67926.1 hypothetical protein C2869_16505 [Saccharobesus litoralis]